MELEKAVAELCEQVSELQTQLAFQEDTITSLNSEVSYLQRQVEALNLRWMQARDQLDELRDQDGAGHTDAPPPHY